MDGSQGGFPGEPTTMGGDWFYDFGGELSQSGLGLQFENSNLAGDGWGFDNHFPMEDLEIPKFGAEGDGSMAVPTTEEKMIDLKLSGMLDLASEISHSLETLEYSNDSNATNATSTMAPYLALSTDGEGLETGMVVKPESSANLESSLSPATHAMSTAPSPPQSKDRKRKAEPKASKRTKSASVNSTSNSKPSSASSASPSTPTSRTVQSMPAPPDKGYSASPQPPSMPQTAAKGTGAYSLGPPQSVDELEKKVAKMLDENSNLINAIRENLMNGKMNENSEPMTRFQRNVITVLQMLASMPGLMGQMPQLPVKISTCFLPSRIGPAIASPNFGAPLASPLAPQPIAFHPGPDMMGGGRMGGLLMPSTPIISNGLDHTISNRPTLPDSTVLNLAPTGNLLQLNLSGLTTTPTPTVPIPSTTLSTAAIAPAIPKTSPTKGSNPLSSSKEGIPTGSTPKAPAASPAKKTTARPNSNISNSTGGKTTAATNANANNLKGSSSNVNRLSTTNGNGTPPLGSPPPTNPSSS